MSKGTFLTPLHEDLHKKLNRFHHYVPNIFIFKFLKYSNEDQMISNYQLQDPLILNTLRLIIPIYKQEIRETLLSWTTDLYPEYGDILAAKYAEKVLYGVVSFVFKF